MTQARNANSTVVIGLGQTGKSCVRFLKRKGVDVVVMDTRQQPPGIEEFKAEFSDVTIHCGALCAESLKAAKEIILSPGLSLQEPALQQAIQQGVPVIGDISLFRRYVKKDIVAITGSNAKSTVTTLVGKLLQDAGVNAVVAGNIGIPVMELLNQGVDADVYVLELSSFQLETTRNLNARVATILNVSEDHMDRYASIEAYVEAKQFIYQGCEIAIVNRDDPYSEPKFAVADKFYFRRGQPGQNEFGLVKRGDEVWLAMDSSPIVRSSELKIKGRHNQLNALAAVAIGKAMGVPMESMVCTLTEFSGLPHRCQWAATIQRVEWFNDSKGTNVGATLAAIEGVGQEIDGSIVLFAGGEGKGADFSLLQNAVKRYVKQVVLFGKDARLMANALAEYAAIEIVEDLQQAVSRAQDSAQPGDAVLLSPACASFDMFAGFEDRGNQFLTMVHQLEATA